MREQGRTLNWVFASRCSTQCNPKIRQLVLAAISTSFRRRDRPLKVEVDAVSVVLVLSVFITLECER